MVPAHSFGVMCVTHPDLAALTIPERQRNTSGTIPVHGSPALGSRQQINSKGENLAASSVRFCPRLSRFERSAHPATGAGNQLATGSKKKIARTRASTNLTNVWLATSAKLCFLMWLTVPQLASAANVTYGELWSYHSGIQVIQTSPMEITTDTPEYCQHLARLMTELLRVAHTPVPHEVGNLTSEGQRMCDAGQTRPGIMRLRSALMFMENSKRPANR